MAAPIPEPLPQATVVFVGHHQSGKSTAAGHILVKLGILDRRSVERLERETSNRPTSRYSWVLDKLRLERDRAMSLDLKICRVVLPPASLPGAATSTAATASSGEVGAGVGGGVDGRSPSPSFSGGQSGALALTLVDTPGHPNYLRNTIAGITQADVAVLVVDSRPAVLESPSCCSQTRDLAQLATSLANTRSLVVAINHLDLVAEEEPPGPGMGPGLAERRYLDAVEAVRKMIKRQAQTATFVPCSALAGDNLTDPSPRLAGWWKGPTLMEAVATAAAAAAAGAAMRGTAAAASAPGLPLRMPLVAVYKVGGIGTVAAGRLAGGALIQGTSALLQPLPPPRRQPQSGDEQAPVPAPTPTWPPGSAGVHAASFSTASTASNGLVATVRSVESFHDSRGGASAGDWAAVAVKGVPTWRLRRGYVVSDAADRPARAAARFTAKIQVLRDPTSKRAGRARSLRPGYIALLNVHTAQAACRLIAINRCNAKGEVVEAGAPCLREGDIAEVELQPLVPLVVEPFKQYPGLGRFAVRAAVRSDGAAGGGLMGGGGGGGGAQGGGAAGGGVTPVIVALGRVESVTYVEPPEEPRGQGLPPEQPQQHPEPQSQPQASKGTSGKATTAAAAPAAGPEATGGPDDNGAAPARTPERELDGAVAAAAAPASETIPVIDISSIGDEPEHIGS